MLVGRIPITTPREAAAATSVVVVGAAATHRAGCRGRTQFRHCEASVSRVGLYRCLFRFSTRETTKSASITVIMGRRLDRQTDAFFFPISSTLKLNKDLWYELRTRKKETERKKEKHTIL